jgi:hypothetical protein
MKKSPLAVVKEQFGSKDKLVDALAGLPAGVLDRSSEDKDAFRQQLLTAANSKLLRLHSVGSDVAKRWGSKAKMERLWPPCRIGSRTRTTATSCRR